jgi:hypothetical protein
MFIGAWTESNKLKMYLTVFIGGTRGGNKISARGESLCRQSKKGRFRCH